MVGWVGGWLEKAEINDEVESGWRTPRLKARHEMVFARKGIIGSLSIERV